MVKHWNIGQGLTPQRLVFGGYHCDKSGLSLDFCESEGEHDIRIQFENEVGGIEIIFLPISIEVNEIIRQLAIEAEIQAPFIPAFILEDSSFIAEVKKLHGYEADNVKYLHYVMRTDDYWINIVSATPPEVTITKKQ